VTVWEVALLVDTGRIDLDIPVEAAERFLDRPRRRGGTFAPSNSFPCLSAASFRASRSGGSSPDIHRD